MKKRMLSALLVLCMVLTMIPVAFAGGVDYWDAIESITVNGRPGKTAFYNHEALTLTGCFAAAIAPGTETINITFTTGGDKEYGIDAEASPVKYCVSDDEPSEESWNNITDTVYPISGSGIEGFTYSLPNVNIADSKTVWISVRFINGFGEEGGYLHKLQLYETLVTFPGKESGQVSTPQNLKWLDGGEKILAARVHAGDIPNNLPDYLMYRDARPWEIQWDHVSDGTNEYQVEFFKDGQKIELSDELIYDSIIDLRNDITPQHTSLDFIYRLLNGQIESGSYTFEVTALGDGGALTDSEPAVSPAKQYTAPDAQLSTPTNLRLDGSVVSWDAVDNANYYYTKIYYSPTKDGVFEQDSAFYWLEETQFDLNELFETGYYKVQVCAWTSDIDNFRPSEFSAFSDTYYGEYYGENPDPLPAFRVTNSGCAQGSLTVKIGRDVVAAGETVYSYASGSAVTITATPDKGYTLNALTVNGEAVKTTANQDGTFTYKTTLDGNMTVAASFREIKKYAVTVNLMPASGGSAKAQVNGADVSEVTSHDTISLVVSPNEGYSVAAVTCNGETITAADGSYQFRMADDPAAAYGSVAFNVVFQSENGGNNIVIPEDENGQYVVNDVPEVTPDQPVTVYSVSSDVTFKKAAFDKLEGHDLIFENGNGAAILPAEAVSAVKTELDKAAEPAAIKLVIDTQAQDSISETPVKATLGRLDKNAPVEVFDVSVVLVTDAKPAWEPISVTNQNLTLKLKVSTEMQSKATASNQPVAVYIADNGAVTQMGGTYADSAVTFTTTHLSYYAIMLKEDADKLSRNSSDSGSGSGSGSSGGGSSSGNYITVGSTSNGKISFSPSNASKGTTVTINLTPNEGYQVGTVTTNDAKGNTIDVKRVSDTRYTFIMPDSKVTISATFEKTEVTPPATFTGFTDVNSGDYYYDSVQWAVEKGITTGTGATTFSPNASCTRAQMVTFLWRAAGSPTASGSNSFTDVPSNAYYYDAVRWAVGKGITQGVSATNFDPNAMVTRGQTVIFLYRYAGLPAVTDSNAFNDVSDSEYYANAVSWAVSEGITNGISSTYFAPANDCTRGQIVTFLYRYAG